MIGSNILTDDRIIGIIKNTSLYSAFPALHSIQKTLYTAPAKSSGCSKCQRNKMAQASASTTNAIRAFKEYVKNMDQATRDKFKQATGIQDIRFTTQGKDGRIKEYRY